MAQVLVRNLDMEIKSALKRRALEHGWSMEEEIRQILRRAVSEQPRARRQLGSRIAARFARDGLSAPIPEWAERPAAAMVFEGEDELEGGPHR